MGVRGWFLAVVVVSLLLSGSAGGSSSRQSSLLITSDRSGQFVSYVTRLDGRGVRALPRVPIDVSVSPDGRVFVYSSDPSWLQRANGSRTPIPGFAAEVAWTPDGSEVAYGAGYGGVIRIRTRNGARLGQMYGDLFAPPSFSPDRRSLLFVNDAEHTELDAVDADGGNLRHIAGSPAADASGGASSPDGAHIAFSLDGDLLVADPAGGHRRELAKKVDRSLEEPAWSPDGTQIAFAASVSEESETIWVTSAAGGAARRVTSGGFDTHPVFSPDGKTIEFERRMTADDPPELFSVPVSGGTARRFAAPSGVGDLAWARDGASFVATVPHGDTSGIGLFTADGHLQRMLTPFDDSAQATFSPDDASIAYARGDRVWSMRIDGRARSLLTKRPEQDSAPRWSTSGISFTVTSGQDSKELDVADISTGRERTIAWNASLYAASETWSPAGDRVAFLDDKQRVFLCVLARPGCVPLGVRADELSWSPDGAELRLQMPKELQLRDRDGKRLRSIPLGAHQLAWSRDGTRAALVQGTTLRLLDPRSGRTRVIARGQSRVLLSRAAWGPRDRQIAYERVRSSLVGTDVFTIAVTGGRATRVTQPFPDGGSNRFVNWVVATPPRVEQVPQVRVIQPTVLARGDRVLETSAEGDRIAYSVTSPRHDCAPVRVAAFGDTRPTATFDPCGGANGLSRVQISGPSIGWVLDHSDEGIGDDDGQCLYVARLDQSHLRWPDRGVACDGRNDIARPPMVAWVYVQAEVAGEAGTLFATLSDPCTGGSLCPKAPAGPGLAVVNGDHPHMILKTHTPLTLFGADARRALVRVGWWTLAVYGTDGGLLRTVPVPRGPVVGGAMVGDDVLALRPGALERFARGSNTPVRSYPVPSGSGRLVFHGAAGGVALYSVGAVLHAVRLSDGVDVALWVRGLTDVVDAVPTPSGLVVGLQLARERSPGVVGTVRWSTIFAGHHAG
ncbi:MAG TPA: hypothetical protein VIL77_13825 [Gaiellaceae bacterium]